jgi:hypothetical protein
MKKAAVIVMAAFYLLLTTGMFVCILHCTANVFVSKPLMVMDNAPSSKKECTKHNCDCCKKHGEYVIKENLKPAPIAQFSPVAVLITYATPQGRFTPKQRLTNYAWAHIKAPPGISGKAKSIQLRSLQI